MSTKTHRGTLQHDAIFAFEDGQTITLRAGTEMDLFVSTLEEHTPLSEKPQMALLADYITTHIPGEPSRNEGAGECAIRIIEELQDAYRRLKIIAVIALTLAFLAGALIRPVF